jgi:hypothetical protein
MHEAKISNSDKSIINNQLCCLENLPEDCLTVIFEFLMDGSISLVCKQWKRCNLIVKKKEFKKLLENKFIKDRFNIVDEKKSIFLFPIISREILNQIKYCNPKELEKINKDYEKQVYSKKSFFHKKIVEMQKKMQKILDNSLETFWKKNSKNFKTSITKAVDIRNWINDSRNEKTLNELSYVFVENVKEFLILPPEIKKFTLLKSMHIFRTSLQYLPLEIGELTKIEDIDFPKNEIIGISNSMKPLKKLKLLDLHENNFKIIPRIIFSFTCLTKLNLSKNNIIKISRKIYKLVELKRLNFSGNLLKTIPTEIMVLNKLEVLLLEDNPLESIPEGVVSNLIRQECEIRVSNNKQYLLVLSKY